MSFWPFTREEQAVVREAGPGDRGVLSQLLARTWRRHGSASLDDQIELLHNGLSTIAVAQGEAHGFFGLHLRDAGGARSGDLGRSEPGCDRGERTRRTEGTLAAMAKAAAPGLRSAGAMGMVCLAPPGWLHEG